MNNVKPFKIVIEWSGTENFYFSCDYRHPDLNIVTTKNQINETQTLPFMTKAMGNVLRKLRKEHISFPFFLFTLAFNHRDLLDEIDQLLMSLHHHLEKQKGEGTFSCFIKSSKTTSLSLSNDQQQPAY
ncbi:hypothetical protein [Chlorobium ferrooxidans]|uniref:Uncharacterized protein n=1 Tax=Chlorobium ferrooxidans DSM 13031 TaxID=377431 RepID=Q0YP97_9CHLB|nr:hypothetical protein [Chlorobium ferrooxidans]EAT58129.1 hypothetical protein CferDRAFT_0136 [Chlorobium ferrooxidans DSM 13031]